MKYIAPLFAIALGCTQKSVLPSDSQKVTETCSLLDGQYPVQNAIYNKTKNSYALIILGAPPCWKQPMTTTNLQLDRIPDGEKEKAILSVRNGQAEKLLMAQDYQMQMVETYIENGREHTTEPSLWGPFLSGMAGGAMGSMIGSAMTSRTSRHPVQTSPTNAPAQHHTSQGASTQNQPALHSTKDGDKANAYQHGTQRTNLSKRRGVFSKSRRRR